MSLCSKAKVLPVLAILLGISAAGCSAPKVVSEAVSYPVEHEHEFGGVYIKIPIEDFLASGFSFGDSVRVEFSNGFVLEDIPFYNGYYVPEGDPLLIGYPGYPYIKAANNNGKDLWDEAGLSESDTAVVRMNIPGKYLEIMNLRDMPLISDRNAFESDEVFASFRSLSGGRMKENVIFRSSSPVDDTYGRAKYASSLMEKYGIRFVINMTDSVETLENHLSSDGAESTYYAQLYKEGNVLMPQINTRYEEKENKTAAANALRTMCQKEGPYLIHCSLGKDRTGFIAILLEMLAGADYEEIVEDYMMTYDSFYHVTKTGSPDKYNTVVDEDFTGLIRHIVTDPSVDLQTADLSSWAEKYLREGGMSDADLETLKSVIME